MVDGAVLGQMVAGKHVDLLPLKPLQKVRFMSDLSKLATTSAAASAPAPALPAYQSWSVPQVSAWLTGSGWPADVVAVFVDNLVNGAVLHEMASGKHVDLLQLPPLRQVRLLSDLSKLPRPVSTSEPSHTLSTDAKSMQLPQSTWSSVAGSGSQSQAARATIATPSSGKGKEKSTPTPSLLTFYAKTAKDDELARYRVPEAKLSSAAVSERVSKADKPLTGTQVQRETDVDKLTQSLVKMYQQDGDLAHSAWLVIVSCVQLRTNTATTPESLLHRGKLATLRYLMYQTSGPKKAIGSRWMLTVRKRSSQLQRLTTSCTSWTP